MINRRSLRRLPVPSTTVLWRAAVVVVAGTVGSLVAGWQGAAVATFAAVAVQGGAAAYRRWPSIAGSVIATLLLTPLVMTAAPQQAVILAPALPVAEIALAPLLAWVLIAAVWSHLVGATYPWQLQTASVLMAAFGGWALGILAGSVGIAAGYIAAAALLAGYPLLARWRQRRRPVKSAPPALGRLSAADAATVRQLKELPDGWMVHGPIAVDEDYADGLIVSGPGGVFAVSSRTLPGRLSIDAGAVVNGSRSIGLDAAAASELAGLVRRSLPRRDAHVSVTAVLVVHEANIADDIQAVDLRDEGDSSHGQVYVRSAAQFVTEMQQLPQLWTPADLVHVREVASRLCSSAATGSGHRVASTHLQAWALDADGQLLRDSQLAHPIADPYNDPVAHPLQQDSIVTVNTNAGMFVGVTASATYLDADGQPVVDVRVPGLGAEQQLTFPADAVRGT